MSNQIASIKQAFEGANFKAKFQELLGKRAPQFMTSVLAVVNNNKLLSNANWESIYQAAITAATLDLPINPNLGFAYIVPYGGQAQFQIGYKGLIQLAQRTGLFKKLNVSEVKEGEVRTFDYLTGEISFDWIQNSTDRVKAQTAGYVAYFELHNGFSKLIYLSKTEIETHAKKYSKSFNTGPWKTEFDSMARKTALKQLLGKYAPLSTEMQTAIVSDQAIIKENGEVEYPDNDSIEVDSTPKKTDLQIFIEEEVQTTEALFKATKNRQLSNEELEAYNAKYQELDAIEQSQAPAKTETPKVEVAETPLAEDGGLAIEGTKPTAKI
jgi:recombination protein RecT